MKMITDECVANAKLTTYRCGRSFDVLSVLFVLFLFVRVVSVGVQCFRS